MKIGIVNSGKSYLPEINAYNSYLNNQKGIVTVNIIGDEIKEYAEGDLDVIWKFPGIDLKRNFKNTKIIHEYNSISTGSNKKLKNNIKKLLNIKPDGRIFLNSNVEKSFNFNDRVPSINRDMGISKQFFIRNEEKEYDFVYVGTMKKSRDLFRAIKPFTTALRDKTILLIGEPENDLYNEYNKFKNITFTGKVNYQEVANLASKAEFGFNYVPDIYPYNLQTSTKLLEYCAMGLKIVTNEYNWVNKFEIESGGGFFKLKPDFSNFTVEELKNFSFVTPDVSQLEWEILFNRINLLNFIKTI